MIFVFHNPESARNSFGPVAPPCWTRREHFFDAAQRAAGSIRRLFARANMPHLASLPRVATIG